MTVFWIAERSVPGKRRSRAFSSSAVNRRFLGSMTVNFTPLSKSLGLANPASRTESNISRIPPPSPSTTREPSGVTAYFISW